MQVGLYIYSVKIYESGVSKKTNSNGGPQDLRSAFKTFTNLYTKKPLIRQTGDDDGGNAGEKRAHRFEQLPSPENSEHGIIRYGSFGYAADVEDVATGRLSHSRTPEEADTIPLYYRLWSPSDYDYSLLAFQSFTGRSCATAILSELRSHYKATFAGWSIEAKRVIYDEIMRHGSKQVSKITLVKPRADISSVARALRPINSDRDTTVDVSLEVRARGSKSFGPLNQMIERLQGKTSIDGVDYERAYATVKVDGRPKKIGVIGVTSTAGVIDVTDEVEIDAVTKHPTQESITRVTQHELASAARRVGS